MEINDIFIPTYAVHPFEILKDEISAMGIKQKDFAARIGMKASNFSRMMKEKSDLTRALAMKLEQQTGIPFDDWMHYQNEYYKDSEAILLNSGNE